MPLESMTRGNLSLSRRASNTNTQRFRDSTGISTPRPRAIRRAPEAPAASRKAPQPIRSPLASVTPVTLRALSLDRDDLVLRGIRPRGSAPCA